MIEDNKEEKVKRFQRDLVVVVEATDVGEADDAFNALLADLQSNIEYGIEYGDEGERVEAEVSLSPDTVQVA